MNPLYFQPPYKTSKDVELDIQIESAIILFDTVVRFLFRLSASTRSRQLHLSDSIVDHQFCKLSHGVINRICCSVALLPPYCSKGLQKGVTGMQIESSLQTPRIASPTITTSKTSKYEEGFRSVPRWVILISSHVVGNLLQQAKCAQLRSYQLSKGISK